jgi:hypothetical protein
VSTLHVALSGNNMKKLSFFNSVLSYYCIHMIYNKIELKNDTWARSMRVITGAETCLAIYHKLDESIGHTVCTHQCPVSTKQNM